MELKKWNAERTAAIIEIACLTLQLETRWKAAIVWGMILATAFRRILAVARLVRVERPCTRLAAA